ncbi:hypothetical protein ASG63_16665 [Methylobacterium sp. Leaf94]|uniref:hypothetical protein n=1 Tax=Methylobacterium sp. Leaf94 TaxID=1736250 RepID=UPI0006F4E112|nr:hypothetical protein [Methylobacterium sp. Leaf94]KQU31126.1 hypothetical protein ASG63_16665 [Methylobacterium sp. Leaf94]
MKTVVIDTLDTSTAVSRIERASNMSRLVDAYDAAVGGSDVSVHRWQGRWQVWHGEYAGFCGSFSQVRTHLARAAEETLDRQIDEAAPAMVAQQAQLQQACAASFPAGPFDALALKAGYTGTDLTITAASTLYAVHGPDGIDPEAIVEMSDLTWLRLLLRECGHQRVFEALVGDSGDPDAVSLNLSHCEDLYRRLAQLVGHRLDIHPYESPHLANPVGGEPAPDEEMPF